MEARPGGDTMPLAVKAHKKYLASALPFLANGHIASHAVRQSFRSIAAITCSTSGKAQRGSVKTSGDCGSDSVWAGDAVANDAAIKSDAFSNRQTRANSRFPFSIIDHLPFASRLQPRLRHGSGGRVMILMSPSLDERFWCRSVVPSFTTTPRLMQPKRWVPPKIHVNEMASRNDNVWRFEFFGGHAGKTRRMI